MPDKSYLEISDGSTSFVGKDAVMLMRNTALKVALNSYAKHKLIMNRAWTLKAMLQAATGVTGIKYKRSEAAKAAADVGRWCDAMKAALPVVDTREGSQ